MAQIIIEITISDYHYHGQFSESWSVVDGALAQQPRQVHITLAAKR
mgnify:CR=1 FL=1